MIIDAICLLVLAIGFYQGYRLGLAGAVFMIIATLVAMVITMRFTPMLDTVIREGTHSYSRYRILLSIILTFLIMSLVVNLVFGTAKNFLLTKHVNPTDNTGGALLFAFFYIFLATAIIRFCVRSAIFSDRTAEISYSYRFLKRMPEFTYSMLGNTIPIVRDFGEYWHETNHLDSMQRTYGGLQPPPPPVPQN